MTRVMSAWAGTIDRARSYVTGAQRLWNKPWRKFEMEVDPNDPFDQKMYSRTYNPELVMAIKRFVRKGDTVIDAGAQKGYVTLHAASRVGRKGRVFSFEPDPRSREILGRNCHRNHLEHVEIFDCALSDRRGTAVFKLSSQLGWSSFYPNKRNEGFIISDASVDLYPLDEILEERLNAVELRRISLVKIDCEGSEPFILRGMARLLTATSPLLWIEINTGSLAAAGSSEEEILKIVSALGYLPLRPIIVRNWFGLPLLTLDKHSGDPMDTSHRVFDIAAVKPDRIPALLSSGIRMAGDYRQ
jgi:FkbM family methyltransferase